MQLNTITGDIAEQAVDAIIINLFHFYLFYYPLHLFLLVFFMVKILQVQAHYIMISKMCGRI